MRFAKQLTRVSLLLAVACATMFGQQWVSLFDAKNPLKGWTNQDPDLGAYTVENGNEVVGRAFPSKDAKTETGYVVYDISCTYEKEFTNFILTWEEKLTPNTPGSLMFRSHIAGKHTEILQAPMENRKTVQGPAVMTLLPPGDVYGPQFVVRGSHEKTGWTTGNIFDDSRRKRYLDDEMEKRPGAMTAWKEGDIWNTLRLEVRGDHYQTFVNDIACADIHDPTDKSGVIALHIHGGVRAAKGINGGQPEARFRNMKIQILP